MTPSLFSIFDVPCPFCGAERGRRCAVVPMRVDFRPKRLRVTPHAARRRAFREAEAAK